MKAVQFAEYGGPEVLRIVDVDAPHAGAGQVRIAVRAAGANGIDWKTRAGYLRDLMPRALPSGIGLDAAGVVDEVGDGVRDVVVGDAVFGSGAATFAEHAVLSSWAAKPAALSFEEAAGYPVPVETAIRILAQVGVRSGQTLLVSGASGGVGSAVVQVARARGITVIGTASERNQGYLRSLGAIPTTYGAGLVERVRALVPNGCARRERDGARHGPARGHDRVVASWWTAPPPRPHRGQTAGAAGVLPPHCPRRNTP